MVEGKVEESTGKTMERETHYQFSSKCNFHLIWDGSAISALSNPHSSFSFSSTTSRVILLWLLGPVPSTQTRRCQLIGKKQEKTEANESAAECTQMVAFWGAIAVKQQC